MSGDETLTAIVPVTSSTGTLPEWAWVAGF
jgi:hypothetical protein